MQAQRREARKHPRYAVEGLTAVVNGVDCAIIDLSVKAVRVVGRIRDLKIDPKAGDGSITLSFKRDIDGTEVLNAGTSAGLNRHCDVFTVISFDVDRKLIEGVIEAHDSFSNTYLKEIF